MMVGDIRNIIVIESLPVGETKTGADLYNDVIRRRIDYIQPQAIKMTHSYHEVKNRQELIEILKYYAINSEYMNGGIAIHFEMHGTNDKQGLSLSDGSFISWKEIVDLLRIININTKNNLFITMATCFGRYLYQGVDQQQKSPYSGYISASKVVLENEIIEDFTTMYETLTDTGNLVYSYLQLEEKGSNFYYKDSKATFEANFEAFKNNPVFKKQIMDTARKAVEDKGHDSIKDDDPMIDIIYDMCLKQAYDEQQKNFEF